MFEKLNRRSTVAEGVNTQEMDFKPLKDFCGTKISVKGFFFTEGRFGTQVVVVGNGYLINMPKRAVEQFEAIAQDDKMLDAVLDGKLEIKNIKMLDTKNGQTVAYDLADR